MLIDEATLEKERGIWKDKKCDRAVQLKYYCLQMILAGF